MTSRLIPSRVLAMIACTLLALPQARADFIPWSYQAQIQTTGPNEVSLYPPSSPNSHVLVAEQVFPRGAVIYSDSRVEFADMAGSGSGSTSVTAFQMRANTDFSGGGPFSKDIHTFNLSYAIRDAASGASGAVTFRGTLDGYMRTYYDHRTNLLLGGEVNLQMGFTGQAQKSLVLGDHLYKVSIDPFTFSLLQSANSLKTLPIISPYQGVPVSVQVSDVPEPSTLALAALGLSGLGVRAWRRRRGRRNAPPASEDSFSASPGQLPQVA